MDSMVPPRKRSISRRWWWGVPALAVVGVIAACSPGRGLEALSVLRDIAGADASLPVPAKRTIRYRANGRSRAADLYTGKEVKAGLVLVPGAARGGKDDPRLVAFAHSLARARFAVLVPDIENVRALKIRPEDAREVADAARYLSARAAGGGRQGVGVAAISYAAGPAILAALMPEAREHVRFVLAIGGYYDITAAVTFFTTGYYREDGNGAWRHRRPNAYGKWVFVRANAERIEDPADRVAVAAMAERKLANLRAPISDLIARLGPEGRSIHALLTNQDPKRVPALIAALPKGVRADMAALDLRRRDLTKLKARLYLVHGRDDPIIPYSESAALALAAGEDRAALYVVDSMRHTDLGPAGLSDFLELWSAIYDVLAARDSMAAPKFPSKVSRLPKGR